MENMHVEETDTRTRYDGPLRVAIVGGTSGLGLALVRHYRGARAEVAFIARTRDQVALVAAETGARGIVGDVASKTDTHRIALQLMAAFPDGRLDVLVHAASSLGPVPLRPLGDTDCEDLEAALATNVVGPFRLTKALLGPLTAAAREGRPSVVLNVSSDAARSAYAGWGAYGASKAALAHLSAIWGEELRDEGVRFLSLDPGDMDTPLHELALPGSDRASLKRPEDSATELAAAIEEARS